MPMNGRHVAEQFRHVSKAIYRDEPDVHQLLITALDGLANCQNADTNADGTLEKILGKALSALEMRDMVTLNDIIEYELIPVLEEGGHGPVREKH